MPESLNKMRPSVAPNDIADMHAMHTVFLAQSFLAIAFVISFVGSPNLSHLVIGKLHPFATHALYEPTFQVTVPHVLSVSPRPQMPWIATTRGVATVEHVQTVWQHLVDQAICDAMSQEVLLAVGQIAIIPSSSTVPKPAGIGVFNGNPSPELCYKDRVKLVTRHNWEATLLAQRSPA